MLIKKKIKTKAKAKIFSYCFPTFFKEERYAELDSP